MGTKKLDETNKDLTNKKMDPEVYLLRRKIINYIHEVKSFYPNLPRIMVRITENHKSIRAMARTNTKQPTIWITEDFVTSRPTVYHEIIHTVFNQDHVIGCPLMGISSDQSLDENQCKKLFLKYANPKSRKKNNG